MSLDTNKSKNKFVAAMRDRLGGIQNEESRKVALEAINNEQGEVQKNFQALGTAVNSILESDAEVLSGKEEDAVFWDWVKAVSDWFGEAKKQYPNLPEPPTLMAPTQLKGKIQ
ncbi:hypothetical protein C8255_06095 [filamentous cyanobacterium CCP3]|nr:hypothetical protein C8255_06095 [filamentous cyanobacterium CCP3]